MSTQYQKLHETYRDLADRARNGDRTAHNDKARVMGEISALERESARDGKILSAQYRGDQVQVNVENTDSKRSLQEQYVRSFDGEKPVFVGGKEQTLREYHSKRLLGR